MKNQIFCSGFGNDDAVPLRPFSAAATAVALAFLLLALPAGATAQSASGAADEPDKPDERPTEPPEIRINERLMVVGTAAGVELIPGSAAYLSGLRLQQAKTGFDDIHRILRRVPGVNLQEEEGFGLRPNIGLRGSGSERSSRITLMEDGVLIAPAPYAAPAAYYFPTTGRMSAVEVRKGSSAVKFGPRTTGGAMNLISTPVPDATGVRANLGYGSENTAKGYLGVGGSSRRWGWLLETYQLRTDGFKRIDGGGDTGFRLSDFLGKARYRTDPGAGMFQEIELKAGYTDQNSDETYLGLTEGDFRADPLRRYAGSLGDNLKSQHSQVQLRHFAVLGADLDLTTVLYRNDFKRNWYKIQSVNGVNVSSILEDPLGNAAELAILKGTDSDLDAIRQRHNNRTYYGMGAQTVVGLRLGRGATRHQLELGVRYHVDQEDRFQSEDGFTMRDGIKTLTSVGTPGSQSNRVSDARALALFAQDRIAAGRFAITPGLRFETIGTTRTDYSRSDPDRLRPVRIRESGIDVLVPGIGVAYQLDAKRSLFTGVHRGFAPPAPGADERVEPETSVNYEVGLRHRDGATGLELVGFFTDYDNLLGTDTLSTGGEGTGDQFNGGAVHVWGVEVGGSYDLAAAGSISTSVPLTVAYTWTRGRFRSSFESDYAPWGDVTAGDAIPYLAEHQLHVSLGIRRPTWDVVAALEAGSAMRTEAGSGTIPPGRGTDAYGVLNLSGRVRLSDWADLTVSAQNVLDSGYVVARRPAGARPGLPRTVIVGFRLHR